LNRAGQAARIKDTLSVVCLTEDEEIGAPGSNYAEATEAVQEENANNSMGILTGNY